MTGEEALHRALLLDAHAQSFVVRLYDGFDNEWMDVTEPLSAEGAVKVWLKKTDNGTEKTDFAEIDYYAIFPSHIKMLFSEGRGEEAAGR